MWPWLVFSSIINKLDYTCTIPIRVQSLLFNYNLRGNCPNVERRWSEREMNSRISGMTSNSPIRPRWMWHTATEFLRVSVIVVLSHVFSLRSAFSFCWRSWGYYQEFNENAKLQTFANSPRTSWSICRNFDTASLTASTFLPVRTLPHIILNLFLYT